LAVAYKLNCSRSQSATSSQLPAVSRPQPVANQHLPAAHQRASEPESPSQERIAFLISSGAPNYTQEQTFLIYLNIFLILDFMKNCFINTINYRSLYKKKLFFVCVLILTH